MLKSGTTERYEQSHKLAQNVYVVQIVSYLLRCSLNLMVIFISHCFMFYVEPFIKKETSEVSDSNYIYMANEN